mmetsp:Transcript_35479/g.95186  ORF Transcript_35479/g.95186 Transcript_35479/m.95186 type:complete len:554 (+) Transcript_35479:113-1774(+)
MAPTMMPTMLPTMVPTAAGGNTRVWGIICGLAGSIAINTGNNLQSLGMHKLELLAIKQAADNGIKVSDAPEIAPYGLAEQSLLASLEAVQFVTNVLFGKFVLDSVVINRMYVGTVLTIIGTTVTVAFTSDESAPVESTLDLQGLWSNPVWLGYLVFMTIAGVVLHVVYGAYAKAEEDGKPFKNSPTIMAVIFATFSALFGTLSVVFAKMLAVCVDLQFFADEKVPIFDDWYFYFALVGWLILMSIWLMRMNKGLSLYDPLFIIPLLQSNFIFFAIVSGGIYFQEFNFMVQEANKDSLVFGIPGTGIENKWFGFIPGIFIMFSGIYLMAPDEEEDEEGKNADRHSAAGMEDVFDTDRSSKFQMPNFTRGGGSDLNAPPLAMAKMEIDKFRRGSMATKSRSLFMGAARMNEHGLNQKKQLYAEEQELRRLMNIKTITREDANKAKELMMKLKSPKSGGDLDADAMEGALKSAAGDLERETIDMGQGGDGGDDNEIEMGNSSGVKNPVLGVGAGEAATERVKSTDSNKSARTVAAGLSERTISGDEDHHDTETNAF